MRKFSLATLLSCFVISVSGQTTQYQYDRAGRLHTIQYDGQIKHYVHDNDKNRINKTVATCSAAITASGPLSFCSFDSVTLYAGAGSTFLWSTGAASLSIVVKQPGNYGVVVTDANGCVAHAAPVSVTVTPSVVPSVSISSNLNGTICSNAPVTFVATDTNGGVNPQYQWLKNGIVVGSGIQYIDSSHNSGDSINCVLTSSAACALPGTVTSAGIVMQVQQVLTPAIQIVASATTVFIGTTVTFTASSTNAGNGPLYTWRQNGIVVGNNTSQYVTNSCTNGDVITCELTNNDFCVSPNMVTSNSIVMAVSNVCSATITASGQTTFCPGGSVTLTASPGVSYLWSNGATSQSIMVSQTGNYTVTVVHQYGCTSTSPATIVSSKSLPSTIKVKALGGATVCAPSAVVLTIDPATGNVSGFAYQWKVNSVAVPGATDSIFSATQSGTVSLTVSGGNCTKTSSGKPVTIKPLPIASYSVNGATEFCTGASVTLNAPVMNGYTYTWLKNGISVGTGISKLVKVAGIYAVVAKLNGCSDTADNATTITVNPLPVASVVAGSPTTFCAGDSAVIHAFPTGTGYFYQWKIGNTIITGQDDSLLVAGISGTYKVIVTDDKGCTGALSSTFVKLTAQPVPSASITPVGSLNIPPNGNVKLKASPVGNGYTYQWFFNGGAISGATSKQYTATQGGDYTVAVTKAICSGTSTVASVVQSAVREENDNQLSTLDDEQFTITVSPNPVNGYLHIQVSGDIGEMPMIHLYDLSGKFISTYKIVDSRLVIDVSSIASGVYIVRYIDSKQTTSTRIIKK